MNNNLPNKHDAAAFNEQLSSFNGNEVLLGYQKRWIADTSDIKIAEKSRRTGLTWAEAADAVLCAAAAKNAGGTNHFYVGSNKEMAIEFIDACAMWAKAFNKAASQIEEEILNDGDKDILTFTIYFTSGFKIQALSSRPSNLRGRQGNVTIDEAAFHEKLAEVLKAALALTMWGAKVRIISTHNGDNNLFNELITDARSGRKRYSIHRITLDDACADGLYKRICQVRGKPWSQEAEEVWKSNLLKDTASEADAREEYYCVPKSGGGSYLSRMLIESRMMPVPIVRYMASADFNTWPEHLREAEIADWCEKHLLPLLLTLNPKEQHCIGEDFARNSDMTTLAPIAIAQDLVRRSVFLVELHNMPFKNQEQIFCYICDRLPRLSGGALDARGNGQYLAEQAGYRYGSGRMQAIMLSAGWYLENMPRFKAAFEDAKILVPQDADVLSDLLAIQVINGIPKLPDGKTDKAKKRHGDSAIALLMAYYASLMDIEMYEYHGIPRRTDPLKHDPLERHIRTTAGFKRGCL